VEQSAPLGCVGVSATSALLVRISRKIMPRSRVTSPRSTACSETWLSHISGARSPPPNHQCCKCRSRQCARARIKTPASGSWPEKALLACGCVLRWLFWPLVKGWVNCQGAAVYPTLRRWASPLRCHHPRLMASCAYGAALHHHRYCRNDDGRRFASLSCRRAWVVLFAHVRQLCPRLMER
jgi:hypothetical protein